MYSVEHKASLQASTGPYDVFRPLKKEEAPSRITRKGGLLSYSVLGPFSMIFPYFSMKAAATLAETTLILSFPSS